MAVRQDTEISPRQAAVVRDALRSALQTERQTQLATKLRVTQGYVSQVSSGRKTPGAALARAMIDAGYLSPLFWTEDPERALVSSDVAQPVLVEPEKLARLSELVSELSGLLEELRPPRRRGL